MIRVCRWFWFILWFAGSGWAFADLTVHVGPPALGTGGPNPVDFPPVNPVGYEVVIITHEKTEWTIGIVPGVFWGHRFSLNRRSYFSMGAGGVIDGNGVGPGVYAAVGTDLCGFVCFNMEYKQAVGIAVGSYYVISPYALRVGLTFEW